MIVYDVWAEWCPPCKRFSPVFDKISKEFPDVEFVKINADQNSNFLLEFGIRGIPTILVVADSGDVLFSHAGILSEANFRNLVESLYTKE